LLETVSHSKTYQGYNDKKTGANALIKIDLARGCGFCFGVREAIKKAQKASQDYGDVQMLGDIVHNEYVVQDLAAQGIHVVENLDAVDSSKPLLFRAHGTEKAIVTEAAERHLFTIDATCPLVLDIHKEIKELEAEGRTLFIVGDHGHDEVRGIQSQVEKATILSSPNEAEPIPRLKKAGVVSQSTQAMENFTAIVAILAEKVHDLRVVNTICHPTRQNQTEIKRIAAENDLVIVIGSQTSANSKRLREVAAAINPKSYQVETAAELQPEWFENVRLVGISAGASTPDSLIQELIVRIRQIDETRLST
jgi:4-hydroxy-3-methylbut-2-en-1-yl diphosphate reductase